MEVIFGQLPSGSGYGDGYGSGYGYGCDDGSGYGYGSGDGYGDGYESYEYWQALIPSFAKKWSAGQKRRLNELEASGATIAYWLSDRFGQACNGGKNAPVKPGCIEEAQGPLVLCKPGTLHATLIPSKWKGERWWIVALHGKTIGDAEKFGALRREIIGECL